MSSSGKDSNKRIRSYLHNEFQHNKYLSIQDYKKMTKQVLDLRNLEHSYLNESLT